MCPVPRPGRTLWRKRRPLQHWRSARHRRPLAFRMLTVRRSAAQGDRFIQFGVQPERTFRRHHGIATATRRISVRRIVTPGADHLVVGGVAVMACSSVSNSRKPKLCRSTGSTQYPATNPGAVRTAGKISLLNTAAAAAASAGSIVRWMSAACISDLGCRVWVFFSNSSILQTAELPALSGASLARPNIWQPSRSPRRIGRRSGNCLRRGPVSARLNGWAAAHEGILTPDPSSVRVSVRDFAVSDSRPVLHDFDGGRGRRTFERPGQIDKSG